jgi:hypothetical protein
MRSTGTTRAGATRYFVRSGGHERGPYTFAQLEASQRVGTLGETTLVRAEDEADAHPLGEVLGQGLRVEPPAPGRDDPPRQKVDLGNIYAPPADEPVASDRRPPSADQGNYWIGFAIGFFGGCIALLLSSHAKPETRRGLVTGFAVALGLGILVEILEVATGTRP